ncbi:metallophosphoesterase family protein [Bacteroidetes bacterium endosymbiont of Geopemphigus sp.]|uniref:metallophosphoesterase family protein n=1 Tax=Bacteroidetes bacterium endosymbiont of Geopemphigus sp. TaxID=2047937 RepID=UPI002AD26B9F|nr:metallophosphoesterase family protein [Bacteroidetes bacterium endosymbiont of Geopemphigus sp.]
MGSLQVALSLEEWAPLKAVYGHIDDIDIKKILSWASARFLFGEVSVWITHIGGCQGRYDIRVREELKKKSPRLFICGHSHILCILYDKKLSILYMNPGAAGRYGFHQLRTMLCFCVDKNDIKALEVIELGTRDPEYNKLLF